MKKIFNYEWFADLMIIICTLYLVETIKIFVRHFFDEHNFFNKCYESFLKKYNAQYKNKQRSL